MKHRLFALLLSLSLVLSLAGCGTPAPAETQTPPESPAVTETAPAETPEEPSAPAEEAPSEEDALPPEDGWYYSKEDVALYIHTYGHLPDNFITKKEAEALGWSGGSVEKYAPGMAIGGSRLGRPMGAGRSRVSGTCRSIFSGLTMLRCSKSSMTPSAPAAASTVPSSAVTTC